MKKMRNWLGAALLLGVLALFGTVQVQAALTAGGTARTTAELNLRKGNGTSYSVIVAIPEGKAVELVSKQDNGWWKVNYSGKTGFVSGKYLTENNSVKKTTAPLRMRTSAKTNTTKNIITTIPKGTVVEVIARYTNGWYRVNYNGKTGYVSGKYLADAKKAASGTTTTTTTSLQTTVALNMRSSMSVSGTRNIMLTIPKGKTVALVSKESNGWYRVTYNKATGYVKSKYLKTVKTTTTSETGTGTASGTTKTMYEALNMRSSMSKASSKNIIDVIPKGAKVTIVSQESGGWFKVKYDGKTGYIMGGHFTDDTSRVGIN